MDLEIVTIVMMKLMQLKLRKTIKGKTIETKIVENKLISYLEAKICYWIIMNVLFYF